MRFDPLTGEVTEERNGGSGSTSLAEMARSGDVLPPELVVSGTSDQLALPVGGEAARESVLKLSAGPITVAGAFEKGEEIELRVKARIVEVAVKDVLDDHGHVTNVQRRHVARVVAVAIP